MGHAACLIAIELGDCRGRAVERINYYTKQMMTFVCRENALDRRAADAFRADSTGVTN